MQKGSLHIELIQLIIILCYNCQQYTNERVPHNRRGYLVVINALPLSIALGYKFGFVTNSTTWRSILLRKNSFASNGFLPFGQLNKFPSIIYMKRLNLHHSVSPQLRLIVAFLYNSDSELNSASLNEHGTLYFTTSTGSA